jgi:poly-gamma-glutamate synthesis protein (capsule biosynthesis protein)
MRDHYIAFLGDIVLNRPVKISVPLPPHVVINLEAPLTFSQARNCDKIAIKMPPDTFGRTFPVRPAAVDLANNHIFDYGAAGFEDTMAYLSSHSIPFFGTGPATENCGNPLILSLAGKRLALMGYVDRSAEPVTTAGPYSCATLEPAIVERDIESAQHAGADFIAVNLHWGSEQVYLPRPADVSLARELLSAGADLVIGHHAHRVQPWEMLGSKAIFYGIGNAIFAEVEASTPVPGGSMRRVAVGQNRPWNRRSLAVLVNPAARTFAAAELRFDGCGLVEPTGRHIGPDRSLGGFGYPSRYRLSHLAGRLAYASQPYFQHRRMPRLSHVRSLWGILASSLFGDSET